jgi:hypothetical protein
MNSDNKLDTFDKPSLAILDKKTGEIKDLPPGSTAKIITPEQKEFLENTQEWDIPFSKCNSDELKKLMLDLSIYERSLLFTLGVYVNYTDCCLKHVNGKELDWEFIRSISGMSESQLSKTMNKLRKKDIIYKGINSEGIQYFVNPWLFCKGNRINRVLQTMFRNYQIRVCQDVKWNDIQD